MAAKGKKGRSSGGGLFAGVSSAVRLGVALFLLAALVLSLARSVLVGNQVKEITVIVIVFTVVCDHLLRPQVQIHGQHDRRHEKLATLRRFRPHSRKRVRQLCANRRASTPRHEIVWMQRQAIQRPHARPRKNKVPRQALGRNLELHNNNPFNTRAHQQ